MPIARDTYNSLILRIIHKKKVISSILTPVNIIVEGIKTDMLHAKMHKLPLQRTAFFKIGEII